MYDTLSKGDLKEFTPLYQEIFGDAPFFEKFTKDEVEVVFNRSMEDTSFAPVLRDVGKIVAFGLSMPMTRAPMGAGNFFEITDKYCPREKGYYVNELAVTKAYRQLGHATSFMKAMIDIARESGYTAVFLRTNKNGSMSKGIALKLGFKVLPEITVSTKERTVDVPVDDERIILMLSL